MIGFLGGELAAKTPEGCILDVGGVGYRLSCSGVTVATLPAVGARCRLWTHLHVREDALTLFGFATEEEQAMFEGLLSVSGIGPKVALALCSAFSAESFRRIVMSDDVASIASVPGVGRKTAQRILLELKDRLSLPDVDGIGAAADTVAAARSALENLGYSAPEIRRALGEVAPDDSVEGIVRSALKELA